MTNLNSRLMPIGHPVLLTFLLMFLIAGPTLAEVGQQASGGPAETGIPPELQGEPWRQITAQIEARQHEVRRVDGVWQAHTPAQDYVTEFTEAGPVFRLEDGEATHEIGLLLEGIDVDGRPVELAPPHVHVEENRFEYQRGLVTEWYVNNPDGVRQWFRVDEGPAGDTLNVAMRLDTDLAAAMSGEELRLSEGDRTVARFAGLKAWDAQQSPLPASMHIDDGRLIVAVETHHATWPITIDPVMVSEVTKLRPRPEGIGGDGGLFGYSVSVDGNRALVGGILLAGSGAAVVLADSGSGWVEEAVLLPGDGAPGDDFGGSVSLSGDRALVGALGDDDNGSASGSAYVFDFNGTAWSQTAKLTASDGAADDQFGASVSLSGDRALVGASSGDGIVTNSGSAYVFDLVDGTWIERPKLTAVDAAAGDQFGTSVSLSGDRALVGASSGDGIVTNSGSAYVFDFNGTAWGAAVKLTAGDAAEFDQFGTSVSLFGDRALVGARGNDDVFGNSGSAYVFDLDGTWSQTAKLTASDPALFDNFGASVSLSGDRALVGTSAGNSAYVFDFNGTPTTWSQTAKLTAGDGAAGDRFGASVSLSGNRALVGAPFDDDGADSGSAYVFDLDGTWSQTAKLTASEGAGRDSFGYSVSLSGHRALVGAPGDDDNGSASGSAYVFDFNGTAWVEADKLTASDGAADDQFGGSVSLSGDRALVGAPFDDDDGVNSGSAYVFDLVDGTWIERPKLTAVDAAAGDQFGASVSLSGDRALVGAPFDDDDGVNSGSAYVFDLVDGTWIERPKLTAGDAAVDDNFGWSVSLSGDRALVGAYLNGNASGSAYVFDLDGTWSETVKLTASDGATDDWFGYSVSLSGDRALVGAPEDDDNGNASGSAYVFDLTDTGWSQTAKLTASDGAADDHFGRSVSLFSDRALIGADAGKVSGTVTEPGSAYVFDFNGTAWSQTAKLTASDGAADDNFGFSVSLSRDWALVGAIGDDDNGLDSGSAYVFEVNESPVAQADALSTDEDSVLSGNVLSDNGSGIDADLNEDPLTVTEVNGVSGDVGSQITLPSGALLTLNGNGSFDYDPNGRFRGLGAGNSVSDNFVYTISDGQAADSGTVTVTINGVDDAPIALGDAATLTEDGPATAIDVLANDIDVDGGPIAVASITQPAGGTVIITGSGSGLSYEPDPDFCNDGAPTDNFTYTLAPGGSTATVAVTVTCVDDAPVAVGDAATLTEDGPATAIDVLANDIDVDGGPIAVASITQPAGGTVIITGGGSALSYQPDPDFCNDGAPTDDFSYTLAPGGSTATVAVTVTCVTDQFTVGGTITGLSGTGLVLRNNGIDLPVSSDATTFVFPQQDDGTDYAVSVQTDPTNPSQTCTVSNESSTLDGSDVTNVVVNCVTDQFTVGGTITGLSGTGLVLRNNGIDLPVSSDATTFVFPAQDDGTNYEVSVSTQPSGQTCLVDNGSGTVSGASVDTITVNCSVGGFSVSGTVSGMKQPGLVLSLSIDSAIGVSLLLFDQDNAYTFPTPLRDGANYTVTAPVVPRDHTCTVTQNASGTISNADADNVNVACTTDIEFADDFEDLLAEPTALD